MTFARIRDDGCARSYTAHDTHGVHPFSAIFARVGSSGYAGADRAALNTLGVHITS